MPAAAVLRRSMRPVVFAIALLLGGCGSNCWECGTSILFHNATERPVDLVYGDEQRGMLPPRRFEPGQRDDYVFSIPRQGDLRKLFITVRATDVSGVTIFCDRMSWREYLDRTSHTIDIVSGVMRC